MLGVSVIEVSPIHHVIGQRNQCNRNLSSLRGVSARYNGHTCEGGVYDIEENLNDHWISWGLERSREDERADVQRSTPLIGELGIQNIGW